MTASGFSLLQNTAKQETTTIQCGVFQYTYLKVQQDVFLDIVLCLFVPQTSNKQTSAFEVQGATYESLCVFTGCSRIVFSLQRCKIIRNILWRECRR